MQIIKLTTKEQFDSLKKGDKLIVQWKYKQNTGREWNEIIMSEILKIGEFVLRLKGSLYFSIDAYLEGKSCASEIYLIKG